jgi:hypothetical protein
LPPFALVASAPFRSSSWAEPGFFAIRNSKVVDRAGMAERAEEVVEKGLGFAFLVAL